MEIKTSDLSGAALDWAVANATKAWETAHDLYPTMTLDPTFSGVFACQGRCYLKPNNPVRQDPMPYMPSTEWEHGGPLIEKHSITFLLGAEKQDDKYFAIVDQKGVDGPTHLIAACRAIVAYNLGDTVTVPDELEG